MNDTTVQARKYTDRNMYGFDQTRGIIFSGQNPDILRNAIKSSFKLWPITVYSVFHSLWCKKFCVTGQQCKLVEGLAQKVGITLQFLPSYSPNLNLIERLWKIVKKKYLYNVYYETFTAFTAGISACLDRVETEL